LSQRTKSVKIEQSDLWAYGLLVVMPMIIALGIYATLRVDPPQLVHALKGWGGQTVFLIPDHFDWLIYNAPDGLWAFSMTSFLMLTSKKDSRLQRTWYLTIGIVVMLGLELLQGSVLAGTFDVKDAIWILVGFIFSVVVTSQPLRAR
jgi:hypothetical protein